MAYIPNRPVKFTCSLIPVNPLRNRSENVPAVFSAQFARITVSGNTGTAATPPIIISDTRNSYPGWSVSCQAGDFTGSGPIAGVSISGNQVGWVPGGSSLAAGVTLGGPVVPAAPAWVPRPPSWRRRLRVPAAVSGPARSART
jgi:hypothetical protein